MVYSVLLSVSLPFMLSFSNNIGRVLPIFFSSFFYGDCYEYLVFVGGAVCPFFTGAGCGGVWFCADGVGAK